MASHICKSRTPCFSSLRRVICFVLLAAGWVVRGELVGNTVLDDSPTFKTSVAVLNMQSSSYANILTYLDFQYAAWYAANYTLMVARRRLRPTGAWQITSTSGSLTTLAQWQDIRNVISMGVSPGDGRLHIVYNLHDSQLYYISSTANQLSAAGQARSWDSSRFTGPANTLMGTALESSLGFGQFVTAPNGALQLYYRSGNANNGTMNLVEYTVSGGTGTWTKIGTFTGVTGTYTAPNNKTARDPMTRSFVPHGFNYAPNARLHVLGTWRENVANNIQCFDNGKPFHDTAYIFSDDYGRNFKSQRSTQLGKTLVGATTGVLSVDDPYNIIDTVGPDNGLNNYESQTTTSAGVPMALISYVPPSATSCVTDYNAQRTQYGKNFLIRRSPTSATTWFKTEIPFLVGDARRSQLTLDTKDNAYVVMPGGKVYRGTAASTYSDWALFYDLSSESINTNSEPSIDRSRGPVDNVISLLYQGSKGIQVADIAMRP